MKTETRLLELTSDVVFKAFMMSENTKGYKARLIHLITGLEEEKLLEAEYVSKEYPVSQKKDKVYKSDIVVRVENNILNIEMNASYYSGIFEKNHTYMNKIRSESFDRGDDYLEIEKVIQINIDNFSHYKGNKIIYKFTMREENSGELECENIESYHIDLENLKKVCYTNSEVNELEKYLKMFIAKEESELENLRSDENMNDAINELEKISKDEKIIGLYDAEAVERKVRNTQIKGAKLEGIEQGKKEEKLEIARKLKELGTAVENIAKVTGLSKKEIDSL